MVEASDQKKVKWTKRRPREANLTISTVSPVCFQQALLTSLSTTLPPQIVALHCCRFWLFLTRSFTAPPAHRLHLWCVTQPSGCCPQSCCKKISTIDPCAAGPMTGSTAVRRRNTFSFSFPLSVVIQRRRGGKPRCRKIPLKKTKNCTASPYQSEWAHTRLDLERDLLYRSHPNSEKIRVSFSVFIGWFYSWSYENMIKRQSITIKK